MANWCYNCIAIYRNDLRGESLRQIQDLYVKLKSFGTVGSVLGEPKKDSEGKYVSQDWYGNLLMMCGIPEKDVECRGSIQDVQWINDKYEDGGWIKIETETAWSPQVEDVVGKMLEDYYPDLNYEFIAEEPGCEIYINTDVSGRFFVDRYKIDYDISEIDPKYCDTEYFDKGEDLLDRVKEIMKAFKEGVKKKGLPEFVPEAEIGIPDWEQAIKYASQMSIYISNHDSTFDGAYFGAYVFDISEY